MNALPPRPRSMFPDVLAGCAVAGVLGFVGLVILALVADRWVPTPKERQGSKAVETDNAPEPAAARPASPLTPAQRRVAAAAELQRVFDSSDLKGFQLRFTPRGERCDVLHVQGDVNLYPQMMEALGYGTVEYGRILPGGVNKFAFNAGFRDVVYSNPSNPKFVSFGAMKPTAKQIRAAQECTDATAAKLPANDEPPPAQIELPRFEPLSWENAAVGTKLYDGSYRHAATILSLDRASDLMTIRYVESGRVEPKLVSAVARYWYVRDGSS